MILNKYLIWYDHSMPIDPILNVVFYLSASGNEPVREWLKEMALESRKAAG